MRKFFTIPNFRGHKLSHTLQPPTNLHISIFPKLSVTQSLKDGWINLCDSMKQSSKYRVFEKQKIFPTLYVVTNVSSQRKQKIISFSFYKLTKKVVKTLVRNQNQKRIQDPAKHLRCSSLHQQLQILDYFIKDI